MGCHFRRVCRAGSPSYFSYEGKKKRAARWDRLRRARKISVKAKRREKLLKKGKSDETIQNRHLKVKDRKRRNSGDRAKMKSFRNQEHKRPEEEKERLEKCDGLATADGANWAANYPRQSGGVRLVGAVASRRARGMHGEVHGSARQALSAQTGARNSRRGWTGGQSFPR